MVISIANGIPGPINSHMTSRVHSAGTPTPVTPRGMTHSEEQLIEVLK